MLHAVCTHACLAFDLSKLPLLTAPAPFACIPCVQVRSICEEMDMDGCERCTPAWKEGKTWGGPNCDPFAVYGWLCVQMPGEGTRAPGRQAAAARTGQAMS